MKTPLNDIKSAWLSSAMADFPRLELPEVFCADDLHGRLPEPVVANWFGCFMARLRNKGLIERVGYKVSARESRNGAEVKTWRKKQQYATATRGGFTVPLIGVPVSAQPSSGDFRDDEMPLFQK